MSLNRTISPDQGPPYTIEVFLSHDWGDRFGDHHVNHEKVRKIKDILVSLTRQNPKYRLKVWFDESKLLPGDEIVPKLMKAIEDTDIFIYFVTKNYQNKYLSGEPDYSYLELQHAINKRKLKIPVILEESMKIEANREGTFAHILKGIFYSDFSTPPLFVRPNPSLLIGRCQALVHAIKSQYSGLDFSVNRFLEDINNLNPEVLIPNKFIDIEQHLENLVKFQINDWKDAIVNNNISTFYQTINQTLSDRFDYLKKKLKIVINAMCCIV